MHCSFLELSRVHTFPLFSDLCTLLQDSRWRDCSEYQDLQLTQMIFGRHLRRVSSVSGQRICGDELTAGRDPLVYVSKKVDIAGVASVLKGYFRELQVPLFPTDNYKAFISCTRESMLSVCLSVSQWPFSLQVRKTSPVDWRAFKTH